MWELDFSMPPSAYGILGPKGRNSELVKDRLVIYTCHLPDSEKNGYTLQVVIKIQDLLLLVTTRLTLAEVLTLPVTRT